MNVVMTISFFMNTYCARKCMWLFRLFLFYCHVFLFRLVFFFSMYFFQIASCSAFNQIAFYFNSMYFIQMVLFCFISIYFWFLYRWGRKPVLIVGIFLLIVPNFIRPWMPNLLLVAMCEFLNAMGSNITYVVPFTIGNCHKIYLIITFVDTLFSFCCLTPSFASLKP